VRVHGDAAILYYVYANMVIILYVYKLYLYLTVWRRNYFFKF